MTAFGEGGFSKCNKKDMDCVVQKPPGLVPDVLRSFLEEDKSGSRIFR